MQGNMQKAERILTVIGSTAVGKSALTIRFINNTFIEYYDPTIARTYHHNVKVNNIDYELTVFDTAGLEQQAQIPDNYIKSHGFILVYSIADLQSFQIIRGIYNRLVDELNGPNLPLVLIGNKSDLNGERVVTTEAGRQLANEWRENGTRVAFIETSALTGEKVDEVFRTLLCLTDPPTNAHNRANNHAAPNRQGSNHSNTNEHSAKPQCAIC